MAIPSRLGRHRLARTGDVVGIHYDGSVTLADMQDLREVLIEVHREMGLCFLLVDMSKNTGIDPQARQYVAQWSGKESSDWLSGTAMYGVSFAMRAISTLMLNAMHFLGKAKPNVAYLKDEAEGRRWIDEQRALQRPGSTPG